MRVVSEGNSLLDRFLRGVLSSFGTTPEEALRRLGTVPTVLSSLFVRRTSRLYDYLGPQPALGHFLNVGWWENPSEEWTPPETFDMTDRCRELVRQVGREADLGPDSHLLDVGFGYGEQDRIFLNEFDCGRITGINITETQVHEAYHRLDSTSSSHRMSFTVGDAVRLPYPSGQFDRLVALESPFHFRSREDFLREAFRVLEPGGKLVLTDIIDGYPKEDTPISYRLLSRFHDTFWQVPAENRYRAGEYRLILEDMGFTGIELKDVTENTLIPGAVRYLRWRLDRAPTWLRIPAYPFLRAVINFYGSGYFRYVIVRACKP